MALLEQDATRGRAERGPRADGWATFSAWLWVAYLAGIGATATWLLR